MNRRGFISALCATLVAPDPDKLLWRPGARLISVPSRRKLIMANQYTIWLYANGANSSAAGEHGIICDSLVSSQYIEKIARSSLRNDTRFTRASWFAYGPARWDGSEMACGEIHR